MPPEIHEALRRLLHERGGLDPATVEVRFDAPTLAPGDGYDLTVGQRSRKGR